jgi:thioredoxin reductase (NADPH)
MRPVLLIVDDDPNVLRAIERDLRQKYGSRFRIFKTASGQKALELVKRLKLRNETLALL